MGIGALPKGEGKGGKKGDRGDQKGSKRGKPSTKDGKGKMHPQPTPMLRRNVFIARKRVKWSLNVERRPQMTSKIRAPDAIAPSEEPESMIAMPIQETTFIVTTVAG